MSSFSALTARLFKRVLNQGKEIPYTGELIEIDAMRAVALIESTLVGSTTFCSALALEQHGLCTSPSEIGEDLADLHTSLHAPNSRSAFASAMGLPVAGHRATVFLTGKELVSCQDLLLECVKQHLPIVIHVLLTDSHVPYHHVSISGCMQFLAADSQQAIDFTMIARQVAETSLIPALVAIDAQNTESIGSLPTEEQAEQWLGSPKDVIKCPTQPQRIMFGEHRRQLPDRWNLERPLLLSPIHTQSTKQLSATQAPYYDAELPFILSASQEAWEDQTGRNCSAISQNTNEESKIVFVCQGSTYNIASQMEDAKVVGIHYLRPFPSKQLCKAVGIANKVIVLDTCGSQLCTDSPLTTEVKAALGSSSCDVVGTHCIDVSTRDLEELHSLVATGTSLPPFVGVQFTHNNSFYPKQISAMDELIRSCPEVTSLSLSADAIDEELSKRTSASTSPLLTSQLWEDHLSSLPRFWDQIATLYQDGNDTFVTPSPLLSANVIPPLTASLRTVQSDASILPVFDPSHCDGDPSLWMSCPDGSVAAVVLSPKAILDAGILKASGCASSLRSISGALCKKMIEVAKSNMQPTVGELLRLAFAELNPAEDRRETLEEGLLKVIDAIGLVPIAKTPLFFDKDAANEFLILNIDPDACKAPQAIIAACAGHGIEPTAKSTESVAQARTLRDLILELPDTSGETINRVFAIEGMKLPAVMLSRHCHHAMAAGDEGAAGSGAKLVLRQALAISEYKLQPHLQELLEQVEQLKVDLQQGATKLLADAIPSSNLDAIAKAIETSGQDEVDLATILESMAKEDYAPTVNGEAVRMMSSLATQLNDITDRLLQSAGGLGRARSGMTISGDATASWAAVFPWNPFAMPVSVDVTHTGCSMAAGLFEGQMQQVLSDLNTIRKAKVVLNNPIQAAHPDEELDARVISDLTAQERATCPPMFIVADAASLHGNALSELTWILGSDLPIKVLILGDGVHDVAMFGLTSCNAYIAQCSLSHSDHFASSMLGALTHQGPALVSVYAPCHRTHGFALEHVLEQASLAVACRVCPLFSYDPNIEGIFGKCIDISTNRAPDSILMSEDLTPSYWASTQKRFSSGFTEEQNILARWQMLQELSGVVTPFDAVARSEQADAAMQHEQALADLAKQYEAKISALRDQYHAEAVASVTSGLMNMAAQARKSEAPSS